MFCSLRGNEDVGVVVLLIVSCRLRGDVVGCWNYAVV